MTKSDKVAAALLIVVFSLAVCIPFVGMVLVLTGTIGYSAGIAVILSGLFMPMIAAGVMGC